MKSYFTLLTVDEDDDDELFYLMVDGCNTIKSSFKPEPLSDSHHKEPHTHYYQD